MSLAFMVSMFLNYYDILRSHKTEKGKKLKYERIPLLAIKIRAISKPGLSFILPTKGREHASDPQEQKLHPLALVGGFAIYHSNAR